MGGSTLREYKNFIDKDKSGEYDWQGLRVVEDLRTHPNYKETAPVVGESIIAFTLRCAAHLLSPPMEPDEDNEFECDDIAEQMLSLEKSITNRWEES